MVFSPDNNATFRQPSLHHFLGGATGYAYCRTDKLKVMGQNLDRVLNSRRWSMYEMHLKFSIKTICYNLQLKTQPKTTFRLSLVSISLPTWRKEIMLDTKYSKTMFLVLDQVYYWGFRSNTHNNYNYIIKTKQNYFDQKLLTTEQEAPSKQGLGLW